MEPCPALDDLLSRISEGEILGRGAQGVVYKFGTFVLKKINFNMKNSNTKQKSIAAFDNEATILRLLSTNDSLKLYMPELCSTEKTEESGYILQRYEPSVTLRHLIQTTERGTLPFEVGISIYRNLRLGLARLMKAGYFHRDIKPENILIRTSSEESMKIPIFIDFGLACSIPTCKHAIMGGTPTYMVPNFLPRTIHQKQPKLTILRNGTPTNVYVQTSLIPYHVSYLTDFYALALTLEEFYPILNFTGHSKDSAEMLTFIAEIKRTMDMDTMKKRRNRMGFGKILTVEGIGTGPAGGGTRKRTSYKKRRASRKS
jgi:serine/threonine protein kinase